MVSLHTLCFLRNAVFILVVAVFIAAGSAYRCGGQQTMQFGKSSLRYSLNRELNIRVQHMATLILMIAFPAKT